MDDTRQRHMVAKLKGAQVSTKRKSDVCRVLLEKEQAKLVAELVTKLKADFCKVDSSKLLNQIVAIFFEKYAVQEYGNMAATFFDKRGYLRNLINTAQIEDIDKSIKAYLGKRRVVQARKQRA